MKKTILIILSAAICLGVGVPEVFAGNYKIGGEKIVAKKILVVFYSRTGNTKKVGEAIAGELNCDTEQIMDVKSRMGIFGWLRSGREAMKEVIAPI